MTTARPRAIPAKNPGGICLGQPHGPMHLGNARGGVLGDTLASILSWTGADVEREFYLNDTGNQVDLLGRSLESRYFELFGDTTTYPFPRTATTGTT